MSDRSMPNIFSLLLSDNCIGESDIISTSDGFYMINKSISNILLEKGILDFPSAKGGRLECSSFFDDWYLYAVADETDYTYSLLKLREQEYDSRNGLFADGDTPGVTISFIAFSCEILLECLADSKDENRMKLSCEIDRVVAYRGQHHHKALKKYFKDTKSQGSYLVARTYTKYISSYAVNGCLPVPEHYKNIVKQKGSSKNSKKSEMLLRAIEELNKEAGKVICDNENIYIENIGEPTDFESAAILTTHTGNTSFDSFATEVVYHARFLTPLAKIKIPLMGGSAYDSAIRADMTVDDKELVGLNRIFRGRF